jgi:gliding motility associated protien GldN
MWSKRVWRRIDLSQKINHPLYFPETPANGLKSLFSIILEGIEPEGGLLVYDAGTSVAPNDDFNRILNQEEIWRKLVDFDLIEEYSPYGDVLGTVEVPDTLSSQDIKYYEIMEDWIFDSKRSVLEIRIIGIKPVVEITDPNGNPSLVDLFWISFIDLRPILVQYRAFNRKNDSEYMTYDALFARRRFGSTIIKVNNVFNRSISDYKTGIDALLEAQLLEEELWNMEMDLWEY